MISSKYGCASPEQNTRETPSNLLSSDDERVPVELIRVAFIKKSVLRSPISELLFLISTSVATNIYFQILKATFWHTIGQPFWAISYHNVGFLLAAFTPVTMKVITSFLE